MEPIVSSSSSPSIPKPNSNIPVLLAFLSGAGVATIILAVCLILPLSHMSIPLDSGVQHIARVKPVEFQSVSSTKELLSEIDHLKGQVNYYSFKDSTRGDGVESVELDDSDSDTLYYTIMTNLDGSVRSSPYKEDNSSYIVSINKFHVGVNNAGLLANSITLFSEKVANGDQVRFAKVANGQIVFIVTGFEDSPGPCASRWMPVYTYRTIDTTHEKQKSTIYKPTADEVAQASVEEAACQKDLGIN